jgi:hypothetical protein
LLSFFRAVIGELPPHYTVGKGARDSGLRKLRPALALFVLLFLGVSLVVLAEDLMDTAYDESEVQPCESTPLISNVIAQAASATPTVRIAQGRKLANPTQIIAIHINLTDAHRPAAAQVALVLLCTLLC